MWCVPQIDQEYVERMEDVLRLYEKPYTPAEPVLCLDEKPVTLHADVRDPELVQEGQPARRDYEYERCGTANVFCVAEPLKGWHAAKATARRTAVEFAELVRQLVDRYCFARTIHVVMDNLNTHCPKSLRERFGEQEGGYLWGRLTVHYTPKHASWLNMAEIDVSLFSRQCLGSRRLADLTTLGKEAKAWAQQANRERRQIHWSFSRNRARQIFGYEPIKI
jgi:transposase